MNVRHPVTERGAAAFHTGFAAYYTLGIVFFSIGVALSLSGLSFHAICARRHWADRER